MTHDRCIMFDYSGAIHIHSNYSFDGTTGMDDIIAAARKNGLDFIVVTDHFRLDAKTDGWEGWHDDLLVLVGEEISPRFNHLLGLGITTPVVAGDAAPPQQAIDAVAAQNGVSLIAHPDHAGAPKFGVNHYPWQDWSVKGFTGVSVWDLMTDWQEKLTSYPAALRAFLSPARVLSGPRNETLARWDTLNRSGKIAGYGEIDNHASKRSFLGMPLRIFTFEYAFSTIRTHALLKNPLSRDPGAAARQVYDAVRSCSLYIAQERWKRAKGFVFEIFNENTRVSFGDTLSLNSKSARVEVKIPHEGRIRLVVNGAVAERSTRQYLQKEIREPGVYRVEADLKVSGSYKPWIYSNPIWVV